MAEVLTGMFLIVALVMVFRPQWIIKFQARFYRTVYIRIMQVDDTDSKTIWTTPWNRRLTERYVAFAKRGVEHPEEYQTSMALLRIIGCIMVGLILVGLLVGLLASFVGTPR